MFKRLLVLITLAFFSQTILLAQVPEGPPVELPGGQQPTTPVQTPDVDLPEIDMPTNQTPVDQQGEELTEEEIRRREIGLGKGVGIVLDSLGIFGHDYLRANNFEFYENVDEVDVDDSYVLGPGDYITVSVWNNADINSDNFTISSDGYVELGALVSPTGQAISGFGRIYLSKLTLGEAREILRAQYSKHYIFDSEDFKVALTGARVINIDIVGEVEVPGSFTVPAINTVFNVLKLSGGPTINGSVRNIQIKRDGRVIQVLDVYKYLTEAENRLNIYLEDNDVVFVPQIGKVVEIQGAIKRETKYELLPEENFPDLLYYANGFKPNALKNLIQIFRYDEDQYMLKDYSYDIDNPTAFQGELFDGDIINVKIIPAEANNIVTSKGALNQTGFYEFEPGMTILDLINKSNGLRFDAVTTRAYLTRYNEDLQAVNIPIVLDSIIQNPESDQNIILFPKDEFEVLSKSDFADRFSVEIYGQVKNPGKFLFGSSLTLQDLLIKAGGFKTDAFTNEIELRRVVDYSEEEGRLIPVIDVVDKFSVDYRFLNMDNPNNKLQLQPFDQIFVRSIPSFEYPTTARISGEVKLPGKYPIMSKSMKISDLIETAGGLTPHAYQEGARFYRIIDSVEVYQDTVIDEKTERKIVKTIRDTTKTSTLFVVDLNKVFRRDASEHNLVLKPGDHLEIPVVDETVSIGGAIRAEVQDTSFVNTAFMGDKNAKWYINEFGAGFDKGAWRRKTQVIYPNGQAKGTKKFMFFNVYPEVQPGSEIVVDYKPVKEKGRGFFGELTIEQSIALVSSMATTAALILAVQRRR